MIRNPLMTLFTQYFSNQAKRFITTLSTFSVMLALPLAQADTQILFQDSAGDKQRQLVMQVKSGKVRMGTPDSMIYMLYDSKAGVIYNINTEKKQYLQNTPELMKERMQKMRAMQKQMLEQQKAQLNQVPEEQRSMMSQRIEMALNALENPPPPPPADKFSQKATGKIETIQNVSCEVVQLQYEGKPFREICLAKQININADDFATLQQMFKFQQAIAKEAEPNGNPAHDAMNKMEGLAIRIQDLPQGMKRELSQLQDIKLDEKLFALDPSFQLIDPSNPPKTQQSAAPPPVVPTTNIPTAPAAPIPKAPAIPTAPPAPIAPAPVPVAPIAQ